MTKLIISGCCGTMGRVVAQCAAERTDIEIVAGIDIRTDDSLPYPVYPDAGAVKEKADVLIDFSHPALLESLLRFGTETHTPLVICTTGYDKNQIEMIHQASGKLPVFFSANMSLGINLLIELSKRAARVLGTKFDVEIIEKHHNQKIDAPSGTALMIADGISSAEAQEMHYVYDRHSQRKKRDSSEIGIHSVRGGTIVGEHEVIFAGPYESLTISHSAQSKSILAVGALNAAAFLSCKGPGLYNMSDLLNQEV